MAFQTSLWLHECTGGKDTFLSEPQQGQPYTNNFQELTCQHLDRGTEQQGKEHPLMVASTFCQRRCRCHIPGSAESVFPPMLVLGLKSISASPQCL